MHVVVLFLVYSVHLSKETRMSESMSTAQISTQSHRTLPRLPAKLTPSQYKEFCKDQRRRLADEFFHLPTIFAASVSFFLADDDLPDTSVKKRRFGFAAPLPFTYYGSYDDWTLRCQSIKVSAEESADAIAEMISGCKNPRNEIFFHWNDVASVQYGNVSSSSNDIEPRLFLSTDVDGLQYPEAGDIILFNGVISDRGTKALPWLLKKDYTKKAGELFSRREIRLLRKRYSNKFQNDFKKGHLDESILWSGCHYHEFEKFRNTSVINTENYFSEDTEVEHDWEVRFFNGGEPNSWMFSCRDCDIPALCDRDLFIKTGEQVQQC